MTSLQERTADIICADVGSRSFAEYEAARFVYAAVNHYAGSVPDVVVAARCVWQLLFGEPIPEHTLCDYYPYALPESNAYGIATVIIREYIPQDVTLDEMQPVVDEVHRVTGTSGLLALFENKRAMALFHICYPTRGFDAVRDALDAGAE